jgi:plastocyanin
MPILRRLITLAALLLASTAAFAQHEHHHMTMDEYRALAESLSKHGDVIPQPDIAPEAVKTQNIIASCNGSNFGFSPNTFTVNQGDTVTINISVPTVDCSTIGHGILMSTYIEDGRNVGKGKTVSVTFTATTAGQFGFVCTQPECGVGHSNMFGIMNVVAVMNPAPTIASVNPNSGSTSGGTQVTITGTNFTSGAGVTFGGNAATAVNVSSSTTIVATTPAHAAGAVDVKVTNADAQSATLTNGFTYAVPAPSITSISPSTGSTAGGTTITITGSGFQNGATVTIGATAATNVVVVSATQITARTPLGPLAASAFVKDVTVRNPDATTATKTAGFTYFVPPLTATNVYPNFGNPAGGTTVTISGAGFQSGVSFSVLFGSTAATNVAVIDPVTARVTAPAHAAGPVTISVTEGGDTVKVVNGYTYTTASPRRRAASH